MAKSTTLDVGHKAPEFSLPATGGSMIALKDLRGQIVILYFYPKDSTPGCTTEACEFRDSYALLNKAGVAVLGVSKDNIKSHEKFAEKFGLNFPLLSDESGEMLNAYGVWIEKSMYGKKYMGIDRATFLIDAKGKIAQVWRNVKVTGHVAEVVKATKELKKAQAA